MQRESMQAETSQIKYRFSQKKFQQRHHPLRYSSGLYNKISDKVHEYCKLHLTKFKLKVWTCLTKKMNWES